MPQPSSTAGFNTVAVAIDPKFVTSHAPHRSPPDARLSWAARLLRLQSGVKFLLPSTHERVVVWTNVAAGLAVWYWPSLLAVCQYLARFTLMAVLPVPKMSYAMPTRG